MTGLELQAIQQANANARAEAAKTKKTPPRMGDVWHKGLLTETHAVRIAQLQAVAGVPLAGDVAAAIRQSSTRGTEGVLLAVQGSTVTSQALRIDARSGALKAAGPVLIANAAGKPTRAPPAASLVQTTVASVPLGALKLYGNSAVFSTLPPSTLGRSDAAAVKVGLTGAGVFAKVPPPAADAVPTITLPPAHKDRATLERYSAAFHEYQRVVAPPAGTRIDVAAVDFAVATNASLARARVDADRTVPSRLASSLSLGGQGVGWNGSALANAFISTSLDGALLERLRYVVPRTFDRVMAFPHLRMPLSRKLETLAADVFLPGVGVLPDDFIMAVKTNPRFVEALMLGANHEMGREMLWQGLPTDQRGTPFQRFWQRLDDQDDLACIHTWNAVPLGRQPGSTEMLVLLIRGQLLERFPNLSIYAYAIAGSEKRPGGTSPPPAGADPAEMDPAKMVMPVLHGHLGRDITYVGLPIAPAQIDKYFFIVEEHMTEPRFGFDERVGAGQDSDSWQDVDWLDIGVANGRCFGLADLQKARAAKRPRWNDPHAAIVADAALQRPFRGYWRGAALKTPD
jgi:hypothetical protein